MKVYDGVYIDGICVSEREFGHILVRMGAYVNVHIIGGYYGWCVGMY